jgi:hypothetical protein
MSEAQEPYIIEYEGVNNDILNLDFSNLMNLDHRNNGLKRLRNLIELSYKDNYTKSEIIDLIDDLRCKE